MNSLWVYRYALDATSAGGRALRRLAAALTLVRVRNDAVIALVAALGILAASYLAGDVPFDVYGHPLAVDLTAHLAGGQIALGGNLAKLYDVGSQWKVEQGLLGDRHPEFLDLFVSPPFVAYLYLPFANRPYLASAAVWSGVTLVLVLASLGLLWPLVPRLHRFGFGIVALVCFSAWPTLETFAAGQDSALALLLLVVGLRLLVSRRDLASGAILGLGAFKPTLFILIPLLLLLQLRRRALTAFLVVGGILVTLSIGLVGVVGLRADADLVTSVFWQQANAANWWKMQSLPSLLQIGAGWLPTTTLTIVSVLGGQVLLWRNRAAGLAIADDPRLAFAQALLITALVSPHFFMYDCVILLIPALILFDADPESPIIRLGLLSAWLVTWTAALRFLTFGTLPFPFWLLAAPPLPLIIAILVWHLNRQANRAPAYSPKRQMVTGHAV